jgi:ankyrin repeat protein
LDETYERVLKEIGMANRNHAFRLLQCLTVAIRPPRVEELAEVLALDFDGAEEGIPELKVDLRWKDRKEAVLSTCSALITVVDDGSHHVVQFSHFSVKEYLTSDRLATSNADTSHFHIIPELAHFVIVKACLGILLRSDNGVGDAKARSHSPLAKYAAEHWVDHAQFNKVSAHLLVGMQPLFDPELPYFKAWLELFDIDHRPGWVWFTGYIAYVQRGSPLYYASLCGFRDLATHLVAKYPQHVNASNGWCLSPLVAALHKRHFDIAELLYQHGAHVGIRGYENRTLLHAASAEGFVDIAQWLLDHCVDAHSQQGNYETPLHLTAASGRLGHCKFVDAVDDTNCTPLYLALQYERFDIVRVLIGHGADVNGRDGKRRTPLHLALMHLWSADTVRVLIEHGADTNAEDYKNKTPLHLALSLWNAETVRVLVRHGANINARNGSHKTHLHRASSLGSAETVRNLLEYGADVNARDRRHKTPLHLASTSGSVETVRNLIKHGADIVARDGNNNTPLHLASSSGSTDIVRDLIELGADIDARDGSHSTPLHLASSLWKTETVLVLLKYDADVNAQDGSHNTPLHLALSPVSTKTVWPLTQHVLMSDRMRDSPCLR